jgi:hypothetical protein
MHPPTSSDIKDKAVELYLSGKGSDSIGKELGMSAKNVLSILRERNVEKRKPTRALSDAEELDVVAKYNEGKSEYILFQEYNVSSRTIHKCLQKHNVQMRPRKVKGSKMA